MPGRGHPSGQLVRRGRVGQRDLAALVVRARRRVRPGLGHPLHPAAPGGRLGLAVPKGRPAPALRLSPEDRGVLADLERPGGRPDQLAPEGQLRQQALEDLAVPCKPPTRSSRWQQGWSPTVTSEFGTDAALHACSRLPVFWRTVMTMGANLPIAIPPGVVTELGRVFELLLRNIGAKSAKRLIVCPREWDSGCDRDP